MKSEHLQPTENLAYAVRKRLGFTLEGENWLIYDDFNRVGGSELYEWLPTRFRISPAGGRYEIGVRWVDIEGLLELTKTIGKNPQNSEAILTFWNDSPKRKFTVFEESEWVFMGIDIEPTVDGFEKEYDSLIFAYDLALFGIIERRSLADLTSDRKHSHKVNHALNPHGSTALFGQLDHLFDRTEKSGCITCVNVEKGIEAETLTDYLLIDNRLGLRFAPGRLTVNGVTQKLDDIWIQGYNGRPLIEIGNSDSTYDHEYDRWKHNDLRITFQVPHDSPVYTIKDLENLVVASIKREMDEISEEAIVSVMVVVDDNKVTIVSEDKKLSLEIEIPVCEGCRIPNWKFPGEIEEENISHATMGGFFQHNGSLGINRFITNFDEPQKTYCADCIGEAVEQYMDEHEYARGEYARQRVEAELIDMGYTDVKIDERGLIRLKNGWHFITTMEYMRGDRSIFRFTGNVGLDDDGNFISYMQPRKFVDFRHANRQYPKRIQSFSS